MSEKQPASAAPGRAAIGVMWVARQFDRLNRLLMGLSMLALIVTACILTYAVATRYFFKMPTDWQDDVSVFMLIGVSFGCAAHVQNARGHIGIDVLGSILPARWNRVRLFAVDLVSSCSARFLPGNPGPCSWKRGKKGRPPIRPLLRRCGFPMAC